MPETEGLEHMVVHGAGGRLAVEEAMEAVKAFLVELARAVIMGAAMGAEVLEGMKARYLVAR